MLVPVDVHNDEHLRFLYEMLKYRNDLGFVNIRGLTGGTTEEVPTYEQHVKYLQTTNRYKGHYLWVENGETIASTYLTQDNEYGIFIIPDRVHQGLAGVIFGAVRDAHPRERITAHVHVDNIACNKGAAKYGFKHVANFWVCEPKER